MQTTSMGFDGLLVKEIFHSIQGESSLAGHRFAFIRLSGCNLRCTYCDTTYSFKGGDRMSIKEVLKTIAPWNVRHVLLTGGEPLMQRQTPALVDALNSQGYAVSIETHGEAPVESVAGKARLVMDIKTPASGMNRGGWRRNLPFLTESDEIKLVIAAPEDFEFAREVLPELDGVAPVLLSPVMRAENTPGNYPGVEPDWLADQILQHQLNVRFQLQLHKQVWPDKDRSY